MTYSQSVTTEIAGQEDPEPTLEFEIHVACVPRSIEEADELREYIERVLDGMMSRLMDTGMGYVSIDMGETCDRSLDRPPGTRATGTPTEQGSDG